MPFRAVSFVAVPALLAQTAIAQTTEHRASAADSGAIRIHLLGHAIGSERFVLRSSDGVLALTDSFEFVDRGGRIQLASSARLTPAFEPLQLRSVGRTYRFVNVDADVAVDGNRAHVRAATAGGVG